MQTIHTRTYTNVALTVIILLLLVLAARPYLGIPGAYAADDSDLRAGRRVNVEPNAEIAAAIRDASKSAQEIATAVRETAKAQQEVAHAIERLSGAAAK